jgi:hypothetical protein
MNRPGPGSMTRTHRALRLLALLFVFALAVAAAAWHGLQSLDMSQVHVMVDGALLMAPLALVGLLCWWLVRRLLRDNKPLPSATMAR